MRKRCLPLAVMLLASFGATAPQAQEYSYDGNRWYEVEVSIFSTTYVPAGDAEMPVPDKISPAYLPRLRELLAPGSSFDVEFPEEIAAAAEPFGVLPGNLPGIQTTTPPQNTSPAAPLATATTEPLGPIYSPAVQGGFRILDFTRDAFVDLTAQAAQFAALNRNLERSGEHRVLWSRTWRQPMLGRAQAQAIFVSGGEEAGDHSELEGSLRLSDSNGGVLLDIDVWLNRFGAMRMVPGVNFAADESSAKVDWQIPDRPFPAADEADANATAVDATAVASRMLTEVWQLEQSRDLEANQLYYLDNPAMGVLIQVRPHLLPERQTTADEADF